MRTWMILRSSRENPWRLDSKHIELLWEVQEHEGGVVVSNLTNDCYVGHFPSYEKVIDFIINNLREKVLENIEV